MKLFCSRQLSRVYTVAALGCLALGTAAGKAGAQAPSPPSPETEQARAFLSVALAQQVLQMPLTLNVENARLESIAEQIQKALAANHSTPKMTIQVRGARRVLLSFATKNSTVGEILRSSGALAGVQLWIFSDHFLLAPVEALLLSEKEAIEKRSAAKAPSNAEKRRGLAQSQQQSLASVISNEVKGLKAEKVTSDQLSPESQAMLQVLLASTKDEFLQSLRPSAIESSIISSFSLSNNPTIKFDASNHSNLQLTFGKGTVSWSTEATVIGISRHSPTSGPSHSTPPFLDPSAGKS